MSEITPDLLLRAYAAGIFPMAESAEESELFWYDPEQRGVLPLEGFHVPKRLLRTVRQNVFAVRHDTDFAGVISGCAQATSDRPKTWINREITALYSTLFEQGFAHSVEVWREDELVGGLYGVALGGAFFGESMFSRATDSSKVALTYLVALLRLGGFTLLDVQFVTSHLARFGAIEIPRAQYRRLLAAALKVPAHFPAGALDGAAVASVVQSSTVMS